MCYLINGKYLFVGDAFGLIAGKITKPNKFFSKDLKKGIESFDKITKLPDAEYIFTAHNGFTNDYKNAVNTKLQ
jgi:hydroxyacylglutathione hydrolase